MPAFVLRRIAMSLLTALGVATLIFLLVRVIPGDPASIILGEYSTKDALLQVRANLGLDRPLWFQYFEYLKDLFRGDLGRSFLTKRPVLEDILNALPYTAQLAMSGIVVSVLIGVPIGMMAAARRNSIADQVTRVGALLFVSTPDFVTGIVLLLFFSLQLDWFPATGIGGAGSGWWRYLVLPAFTVGANYAAVTSRITRSAMLEVLGDDYVRTARAKGLAERTVFYKHALRNALIPISTVIGLNLGRLLGGTVVIEQVFSRDGLGTILIQSLISRDYALVQGVILVFALTVAAVNLTIDVAYAWIDPRIRYA